MDFSYSLLLAVSVGANSLCEFNELSYNMTAICPEGLGRWLDFRFMLQFI